MYILGIILEILHVCPEDNAHILNTLHSSSPPTYSPNQHVAQLDKVTVVLVFHLHHPPGVQPPTHTLPIHLQQCVAPHNGERNRLLQMYKGG